MKRLNIEDVVELKDRYLSDEKISESLRKVGARCTLYGVYGLFHGCVAAPGMVMPSSYISLILEGDDVEFESREEAVEFFYNLMTLWNRIAHWEPEAEPFLKPTLEHPETLSGLKVRGEEYEIFISYFIKGLHLGGIVESDFTEDALEALKSLSDVQGSLRRYSDLDSDIASDGMLEEAIHGMNKLEETIGDCIARINLGLKPARMRTVEEMRQSVRVKHRTYRSTGRKIGRNEPCPCGSGKKYKRCCGLPH